METASHKAGMQQRAWEQTLGENVDEHTTSAVVEAFRLNRQQQADRSIDFLDHSSTFSPSFCLRTFWASAICVCRREWRKAVRLIPMAMIKRNRDGMAMTQESEG